jgi:hypothetical protein
MMKWFRGGLLALIASACLFRREPRQEPEVSRDTSVVVTVSRAITEWAPNVRLRVDPEPLPRELNESGMIPTADQVQNDTGKIWTDFKQLVRVGLRAADTHGPCAGPLSPDSLHVGCPREPELVAVIGAPRRGGALRIVNTDSARLAEAKEKAPEYWTVRVFLSEVNQFGFAGLTVYDYVLRKEQGGLKFVRKVALLVVE